MCHDPALYSVREQMSDSSDIVAFWSSWNPVTIPEWQGFTQVLYKYDDMVILLSKEFTESGQKRHTSLGVAFTLCVYTNQVETLCYPPMELISSLS